MVRDLFRRFVSGFEKGPRDCGLVLGGGGARAAYQVGVLQYIGEHFPGVSFPIMTGVSAGAINAAHLANHVGPLADAVETLVANWSGLTSDQIYEPRSSWGLFWDALRRNRAESVSGKSIRELTEGRGLVDTEPLRTFLRDKFSTQDGLLRGIARNLERGRLKACAVITTSYTTGQTITWVEGADIQDWERPDRIGMETTLSVEHVMASASLPLFFPAVPIDGAWYGDGGVRLTAPLAPAIHLGAERLLVISTHYNRTRAEANEPVIEGYPPTEQVLSLLANAVFLDALDQDVHMLERINTLLEALPRRKWGRLRPVKLLLMRPSVDLGKLAGAYELELPSSLRLITWTLGSWDTKSPDSLSILLFEQEYLRQLIEIGYGDARRRHDELEAFLADA